MHFIFVQFYLFFSSLRVINTFFNQFSLFFHFRSFEISFHNFQQLEISWKFITVSGAPTRLFSRYARVRATTYYRPACFSMCIPGAWAYFKNTLQKFLSACPKCDFPAGRGRISDLPAKNSCHLPNTWVSAKRKPGAVPTNRSWL